MMWHHLKGGLSLSAYWIVEVLELVQSLRGVGGARH
jgi:hypothetical protein